jgi:hypothetical protein
MEDHRAIEKALSFLNRKYKIAPKDEYSAWIIELYRNTSKPLIRPYHIENPIKYLYQYIFEHNIKVFAEHKYDGTHIQISKQGIFKHSGDIASSEQLGYLIYIAHDQPELMIKVKDAIQKGYILECEIFGKHYTPRGFHKDYQRNLDLVVFELGKENSWITPPEKYEILNQLELPNPPHYNVEYSSAEDLEKRLSDLALMPESFEGIVAKGKFIPNGHELILDYVKSNLLIFKVKKEILSPKEEKHKIKAFKKKEEDIRITISAETYSILRSEIENEVAKIAVEKGKEYIRNKKNIPLILNEIIFNLRKSHTSLILNIDQKELKKLIAKIVYLKDEINN